METPRTAPPRASYRAFTPEKAGGGAVPSGGGAEAFKGFVKTGWEQGGRRMGICVVTSPPELRNRQVFFHSSQVPRPFELGDGGKLRGSCVPGGQSGYRAVGNVAHGKASASPPPATTAPFGVPATAEPTWGGAQRPQAAPTAAAPSVAASAAEDDLDELEERWFAQISTHVVGVSHHEGKLTDGEEVSFSGKMVMNAGGKQAGWLPKEISPSLLPMILRQSRGMKVEGVVPRGSGNKFKVPLDIQVYGLPESAREVNTLLDAVQKAAPQFAGLAVIRAPTPEGIRVVALPEQKWEKDQKPNLKQLLGEGGKKSAEKAADMALGSIFAAPVAYEQAPELAAPAAFRGELLEHQRKALHWMAAREELVTAAELLRRGQPCLWTKEAAGYRNKITGALESAAPVLPRGGVLADDMGMGKTATTIALLLARPGGLTLLVCPLVVLSSWKEQLARFAPNLRVGIHHGGKLQDLSQQGLERSWDVVITTYQTLAQGALAQVQWRRVVLDEAHEIRNVGTQLAKAAMAAEADVRWCLTGTPLFNGLSDLYGLVAFLRIEPFCQHRWWLRSIARPARVGNARGFARLAQLLGTFLLRRSKSMEVPDGKGGKKPVLSLPPRTCSVERVAMGEEQKKAYDRLFELANQRVHSLHAAGKVGKEVTSILSLLTQLRQLCLAPALLPAALLGGCASEDSAALESALQQLGSGEQQRLLAQMGAEAECPICLEELQGQEVCATKCAHVFHRACLLSWLGGQGHCPSCRAPCRAADLLELPKEVPAPVPASVAPLGSAKLDWAEQWLLAQPPGRKVVVFSHFVRLLGLLAERLSAKGVATLRLQGDVTADRREAVVKSFQGEGGPTVLLCSVRCAGQGVTLTRASAVLLLDPWWNRPLEEQAVDRVHRIGQKEPVEVVRLVAKGTIEEAMLAMQDAKREISDAALAGPQKEGEKARLARLDVMLSVFDGPWRKAATSASPKAKAKGKRAAEEKAAPAPKRARVAAKAKAM